MASSQPDTKKLDQLYEQARSNKRMLEPDWLMNLAYFRGRQWLKYAGGMFHQPQLDPNRITVTENRIAGVVRTELAKMTKNRPVFVVTPETGDEADANASDVAERLMRYLWKHLSMQELALKALEWSRVCSAGFLKCYWDSTLGDPIDVLVGPDGQVLTDPQSGKPMYGDQQAAEMISAQVQQRVTSKRIAQGDVRVEVRSPFQMFIDPMCDSFPEAEWLIEESVKSLEYAKRRYGDKANGLKADTPANPGLVEARMIGAPSSTSSYKGVKIREYWCKPCSDYPNGCRTVWSQNTVLDYDPNPFDPMPYVMLTGIPTPGSLWPMAPVELLRGPQTELNKTLSQMAENRNRIGNPTLVFSKQAMADWEKFSESVMVPGGAYGYDEAGSQHPVPSYLDAPPLPEYVTEIPGRTIQAIEDISGQHEVTNAQVPPGITAASAITLLQEADDTRLGLAIQDYEVQIGRLGTKLLKLVANFYTDARTIKIAGDDGAWEIFDFRGSQLRGNTTVDVQAGSAFPQSLAAKQAMIKDLITLFTQTGNPLHGQQLARFLRDIGMGATDNLIKEFTDSEAQINRENMLLTLGQPLQIHPEYDDHEAHVTGHQEYARSSKFQSLSPPQQQPLLQHLAQHQQVLDQQQQQQLQMELMMAGKVPPNTTQAAYQEEQELSQLHGVQQQNQLQQAQGQQQLQGTAQQQGLQQAQAEQQQRQQAELHQHEISRVQQERQQAAERHQQEMQHREEQHQARIRAQAQQARSGGSNGR